MKANETNLKPDTAVIIYQNDTVKIVEKKFVDKQQKDTITVIEKDHFKIIEKPINNEKKDFGKIAVIVSILIFSAVAIYKRINEK